MGRSGRHSGCAHSTACSVRPYCVQRERDQKIVVWVVPCTSLFSPIIHVWDILTQNRAKTGFEPASAHLHLFLSSLPFRTHTTSCARDVDSFLEYSATAFAVDSHGYSVLVHVRWILTGTAHLCICGGSQETTVHLYHSISLRKIALRYFFFFFSQFSALPPTHMFFNLRPVANFGLVLPAVLKFSAFRLQWGVFIALMLFMLSKYPSFTPECEGGSIQEKNGDCILRMWNKGGKDVKEI